jgi:hypothetical protein
LLDCAAGFDPLQPIVLPDSMAEIDRYRPLSLINDDIQKPFNP